MLTGETSGRGDYRQGIVQGFGIENVAWFNTRTGVMMLAGETSGSGWYRQLGTVQGSGIKNVAGSIRGQES